MERLIIRKKIVCSKCNKLLEKSRVGKQAYCKGCHAEHMRNNRPKHSELKPTAKLNANARAYAGEYYRRGKIKKQPCFGCGGSDSQKHHEDYTRPLDVTWMCRQCHLDYHQWKEKRAIA